MDGGRKEGDEGPAPAEGRRAPAPGGVFLRRGALQDDTLLSAGWLQVCGVKGRLEGKATFTRVSWEQLPAW